jgi:hypothetical protein
LLVLAGCNSLLGVHDFTIGDAAEAADAPALDGAPADASNCIGAPTGLGPFCQAAAPTGSVMIGGTFATDTCMGGTLRVVRNATVCAVVAAQIAITQPLHVTGAFPLALVAQDAITVTTQIDVGSRFGFLGAGSGTCAGGPGTTSTATGSGGAGGSFGALGGRGGGIANNVVPGGTPNPVQSLTALRIQAGCSGGTGGEVNSPAGDGGAGGGAIYLAAGATITIQASIFAGGAGGQGGGKGSGGGGGGSGGLIGLDAPSISIQSGVALLANGGGGAGGDQNNTQGHPGQDAIGTSAALGGDGNNNGGGGMGSFGSTGAMGGTTLQQGSGAGGGGGGAGIILEIGTVTATMATISPAFVTR